MNQPSHLTSQIEIEKWLQDYASRSGNNIAKMRRILRALSEETSVTKNANYGSYFSVSEGAHPIQRWFECREGFSIDLATEILRRCQTQRTVLDPFCGAGTTLLASNELGIHSIGFDINPLAAFVSKAKTVSYSKGDIEKLTSATSEVLSAAGDSEKSDAPGLRVIGKVFNAEILDTLLKFKYKIGQFKEEKIHDFLKLGWIAILEAVSNTRKEGNGIKYRFTRRTDKGYVSIPQQKWEDDHFGQKKPQYVTNKFKLKYTQMLSDLHELGYASLEPRVFDESALELTNFLDRDSVSTVLFSPPYANSFDYFEIFKIELWMGDFINSYSDLKCLRNRALRSNLNTNLDVSREGLDLPELDELVGLMRDKKLWDKKVKKMVVGYFEDMNIVLKEIYKVLEPDGKCVMVVGNSAYADILVPTDLLLSKLARQIGFRGLEVHVARHLTTSSQQRKRLIGLKEYLRESVVCFSK